MAEYIDREKVLIEMDCGIRAGNYEEGFENYQHVNCMDDCLDVVRYADSADVVERSKIDKAIEEINNEIELNIDCDGIPTEYAYCYQNALEILKRNIGE